MKKYLQVFSGGFSNLEVDIEKLKEKLLKIMKIKKIDGIIIGWNENKELYRELKDFLRPYKTKLYFWFPVFSELSYYKKFNKVLDYKEEEIENFSFQEGENFEFYCPNTIENMQNIEKIFDEKFSDYEIDGVFLDKIRYPAFSNGGKAVFSCFCPACIKKMKEKGIDVEKLKIYIEESFGKSGNNPLEIEKYENFRYKFKNKEMDQYFQFKNDSITEKVNELIDFFKGKGLEVGLDTYASDISYLFGQDITRLSQKADFIKPMYYRRTYAPAGIPFEIQTFEEMYNKEAGEFLLNIIGEKDLKNNIGKEQMKEEVKYLSENLENIFLGIDFNKKENIALSDKEYIKEVFDILEEGNSKGIVLSWDLMSIPEEHLKIFLEREEKCD